MGKKLSKEELKKLCTEIMHDMWIIYDKHTQDTPKGIAKQKEIISKIDEHPEVLRVQIKEEFNCTIGIYAVDCRLLYITMRALEDNKAHKLRDKWGNNIFDLIKKYDTFRKQIVNSWQYKRLVERLEARLAGKEEPQYDDDDIFNEKELTIDDKYEIMDKYDNIME